MPKTKSKARGADDGKVAAAKAKAPLGSTAEARCMKDKAQVEFLVEEHDTWSNGMVVAIGHCECGTKVQRILGKA